MARICKTADDAGCPKSLVDEIFSVIRQEQINGCLDICDPNITKRESFFRQASKALRHKGITKTPVKLEDGTTVTVCTLDFAAKLQDHLTSTAFSDLKELDLPDPDNPWSSLARSKS